MHVGLGVLCGADGRMPETGQGPDGLIEHLLEVVGHFAAYRAGEW